MSCGKPHQVPCSEVLARLYTYLDGEIEDNGYAKIREHLDECGPCLREMPSLERLQSRLGERVAVLAVSEDRGGNKSVEPFIAKLGLKSVKIYIDPKSEVGHAFGMRGLPTSFLIDREGKVLGRVEGAAEWDSPKILGVLEPLLSGGGVVKASSR